LITFNVAVNGIGNVTTYDAVCDIVAVYVPHCKISPPGNFWYPFADSKLGNTAAVVCVVPSGNLNPQEVDSTIPATESFCPGVVVPIPTFPLGSILIAVFVIPPA
jgi:hypothetical protein